MRYRRDKKKLKMFENFAEGSKENRIAWDLSPQLQRAAASKILPDLYGYASWYGTNKPWERSFYKIWIDVGMKSVCIKLDNKVLMTDKFLKGRSMSKQGGYALRKIEPWEVEPHVWEALASLYPEFRNYPRKPDLRIVS